jgi:hypothetical protein
MMLLGIQDLNSYLIFLRLVSKNKYHRIRWPCFSHFALLACLLLFFSQGSWIVKQSVGKKACLVGQALEVHYFRGKNYLEVG